MQAVSRAPLNKTLECMRMRQPYPRTDRNGQPLRKGDVVRVLKANGCVPSMNRPQTCQDNAHMESFFRSLKAEFAHKRTFPSDAQLCAQLGSYIDRFYNTKRLHSSLGYHSPVEFECLAGAAHSVH